MTYDVWDKVRAANELFVSGTTIPKGKQGTVVQTDLASFSYKVDFGDFITIWCDVNDLEPAESDGVINPIKEQKPTIQSKQCDWEKRKEYDSGYKKGFDEGHEKGFLEGEKFARENPDDPAEMSYEEAKSALYEVKNTCENHHCATCAYSFVAGDHFECLIGEPFRWGLGKVNLKWESHT